MKLGVMDVLKVFSSEEGIYEFLEKVCEWLKTKPKLRSLLMKIQLITAGGIAPNDPFWVEYEKQIISKLSSYKTMPKDLDCLRKKVENMEKQILALKKENAALRKAVHSRHDIKRSITLEKDR